MLSDWIWKWLGLFVLLVAIVTGQFGCGHGSQPLWSQAKPETVLKINPITRTIMLHNSKDVDITIEEFSGSTPNGITWVLKGLVFRDNASDVRTANVQQLEVAKEITEVAIAGIMSGFQGMISELLVPLKGAKVSVTGTPLGDAKLETGGGTQVPSPE